MSIPVATTTITVERSSQDGTMDAFDLADAVWSVIASGVRAVIGSPSGTETVAGGSSEERTVRLNCDPTDLRHGDRVYDESTAITYEVTTTARRLGFGIDHTTADLLVVVDRTAA